jgi:tetratricopeptide (TPR) repeat protein
MSASVRVVGYLAEMSGKAQEFRLKEADTNKIEKFHLQADFNVLNNLIKASHEEPIFTEEELRKLKKDSKTSLENRIRLPKIFFRNHLEPVSERAFNIFMEGIENLTNEEISLLPQPNFEEVEGDAFASMQARAVMGEPVIIDDGSGALRDVRLLFKQRKFDEVIELYPLLAKFPRNDFAEYLAEAFLKQGELLLKKSLSEEGGVRKALEKQAYNFFDRAIEISPNVIDTHISLGVIFGVHGLYERAIRCFEWVMSAQPQNAMARHNLARTYLAMGRLGEALDAVNKAIEEIQGVQPKLHLLRARVYGKEGKYQEATADLISVWKTDFKEIIENEHCHEFVRDVYNNYSVLGTAVILSDIYSYYVSKLAKANLISESTRYLNTTVTLLEDIHKTIKDGDHNDFFEASFYPVLSRVEKLVDDISSVYPTDLWKARLEALRPTK